MAQVRLAVEAMRSRFEFILEGDNPASLQAAGEEAVREILSVERLLHPFEPSSDLASVRGTHPVTVSGATIRFLQAAQSLTERTFGAFDLTAASGGGGFLLSLAHSTVRLPREGMRLDPGALGKGWALERAADLLRESGVAKALLHGGTSSVVAIGAPEGEEGWRVGICDPSAPDTHFQSVCLADESLSVSSNFERPHILDPKTGLPIVDVRLAIARTLSATEAEALSTALLVLGREGISPLSSRFPDATISLFP